jgi:hypothetical protein
MNKHVLISRVLPQPNVVLPTDALPSPEGPRKRLAAITPPWFRYSHADDIITKFIVGYSLETKAGEAMCEEFVRMVTGREGSGE